MKRFTLFLLLSSFAIVSCGSDPIVEYIYRQPEEVEDGFETGNLTEVGLNEASLGMAVDDIHDGEFGEIHSLLIYKDGKLVFEEYFPGHDYAWDGANFYGPWINWDRDTEHCVHSVGKSITSACVGIAVELGHIESVNQSIFDYLPEYQYLDTAGKNQITIEQMLTMTAGLEWDEWGTSYSNESNDVIALWFDCDDPIACILERPMVSEPGRVFTYSGGNAIVLAEIVRSATNTDIEAFCGEYLFAPLGIETPEWRWIGDTGVVFAAADQKLTPREMLKLGVLSLNEGVWDGQQIISNPWVQRSSHPYSGPGNQWLNSPLRTIPPGDSTYGPRGYSYTWWTHEFSHDGKDYPAYWAFGWGGQKIVVFPDQAAVVVFTGGNYTSADATAKILTEYVIPAFE